MVKLYRCYEARLRADDGLVDMGDLVMLPALALANDHAKFLASVGRFKHVLVDEYQDVNRASARLVQALAKHAQSLWVVGDARQAIYRFRGASMRNILRFGEDFENRRSYAEVVKVFEHTGRDANPLLLASIRLGGILLVAMRWFLRQTASTRSTGRPAWDGP